MRASLDLFNERGEGNVALAQIAANLDMSEGNLWYHFRTKHDLVAALFTELEERVERNLSRPPAKVGNQLADFADYTTQAFRDIWEYRFLFRHRFDRKQSPALADRFVSLTERAHRHAARILGEMVRRDLMQATAAEIAELTANAWIILRYWLDYLQERHGVETISEADFEAGVKQIFALYRPYLTEAAQAQIPVAASAKRKAARG
ncbi:MAG TPA: TetR/AcrR family transcriptional regulator [Stellaceae bacterium]|nr:TetR/AcrR family transcriptional regulator [Stellaceae bacterium]